jgi:hypothetical protein
MFPLLYLLTVVVQDCRPHGSCRAHEVRNFLIEGCDTRNLVLCLLLYGLSRLEKLFLPSELHLLVLLARFILAPIFLTTLLSLSLLTFLPKSPRLIQRLLLLLPLSQRPQFPLLSDQNGLLTSSCGLLMSRSQFIF